MPPFFLACFAAAPIAKERGLTISIQAVKIAAAGFVIPFMAVYTPALMLQDGGPLAGASTASGVRRGSGPGTAPTPRPPPPTQLAWPSSSDNVSTSIEN